MVQHVVGRGGERIDRVARTIYGGARTGTGGALPAGAVEALLAANQDLAALGPVLPAGTVIDVPELVAPATNVQRIWE